MDSSHALHFLHQAIIVLTIAAVIVPLLQKCRISSALGFLICGIAIGPHGLAHFIPHIPSLDYVVITDTEWVHLLAEIGVVLLLFMIGLELSIERLMSMKTMVLGLGTAQIIVTACVITAIAYSFDNSIEVSLLIGASLALSSTATVVGIMKEKRLFSTPTGTTCFSILLMQDLAVVPIIILHTQFSGNVGDSIILALLLAMAKALLTIVTIIIIGRICIRPILSYANSGNGSEGFMPLILLIIIGAATLTQFAGLSLVLGAFLAGLLINETEYRHEVELIVDPLRSIFMGIFFLSIGMMIDLRLLLHHPLWIPLSLLGIFTIKGTITALLCLLFKLPLSRSIHCGLLLGQGGEFAFLVIGLTLQSKMLSHEHAQFLFIVVALSMLLSPLIALLAQHLATHLNSQEFAKERSETQTIKDHIVIFGFGRVGVTIAKALKTLNIPYLAIDSDPRCVTQRYNEGYNVCFGDASRISHAHKMQINQAKAILITLNDFKKADIVLKHVRNICTSVPIIMRAKDKHHIAMLRDNGADHIIPETLEASLQMSRQLLSLLNIPEAHIDDHLNSVRKKEISPF